MVRRHMSFYGSVQGVGFRFRAVYAARCFDCTGWVRNEWDGSVSMEIQGEEDSIARVVRDIEGGHFIRIDHIDCLDIPLVEDERGFRSR